MVVLIIIPVDTRSCIKELLRERKKRKQKEYTANAIQTLQFPSNIITLCSFKI